MASELKPEGFFMFDRQDRDQSVVREERPNLMQRLRQFISSRYALLTVIFLMCGALIFYNTAVLQFNPTAAGGINETSGVARQQVIKAPRGDIIDASGIPLAYSKTVNLLQISSAGLDSPELNAMLLDLANFLEEQGVAWETKLTDYLDLDHSGCSHPEGEEGDCGTPVFVAPMDEIVYWQTSGQVFSLKPLASNRLRFDNDFVKDKPDIFYDYLLYKLFKIEDPEADGQRYIRSDAFKIMRLRYLLFENNWAFRNIGTPLELVRGISDEVVQKINEQNYRFKGVIAAVDYERAYTEEAQSISHVLGYIAPITADQYNELRAIGYASNALVGYSGVEKTAERYLAGQDGSKPYNIWTVAGEQGMFFSDDIGKDAMPGYNVRLTIDMSLQKTAENALKRVIEDIRNSADNKNKGDADAGSVVMLDVHTGAVLAMVSYPSYDPNDFIRRQYDDEAADRVATYLTDNVNKPMLNRTMMEIYAPGSTFKAATSVAALESGAITRYSSTIRCVGNEIIGDWHWFCLEKPRSGHGDLDLTNGLATSCNLYFYNLGVRTGINEIDKYGKMLGLGEYTGIDLPGEVKGYRASRETKKLLRLNAEDQIWFPADTCQSAIGQFDNSFTILQLAVYTAALATGKRVTPHVIDTITGNDGVIIRQNRLAPTPIDISESTLEAVRQAMVAVAHDEEGTAFRYFENYPLTVAAKTGTAETGFEDVSSSNGLFIAYAPADNPQVAVAQIIEKGAWGSNTIGITKDLFNAYFRLNDAGKADPSLVPGWPDQLAAPTPTVTPTPPAAP